MKKRLFIIIPLVCLLILTGIFAFIKIKGDKNVTINFLEDKEVVYDEVKNSYSIGGIIVEADFHPELDTETGETKIVGTVSNTNDYDIEKVKIHVTFYNEDNRPFYTHVFELINLNKNDKVYLDQKVDTNEDIIYKATITKVEGYRR